ncbi:hypothetical protein NW764_002673 [Fusarium oxysporum]|nr:hypothetical protein NW764_002673 [Fusarium oxysporum]
MYTLSSPLATHKPLLPARAMESLQLSQVLADLSNIGAADPGAAEAIVSANNPSNSSYTRVEVTAAATAPTSSPTTNQQRRPTGLQRHWSSEKFDKFGRRILSPGSHSGSAVNSSPGTPRRGESDFEEDLERAGTLMQLYDIRSKIKQQDNSSLLRAREKVNAIAARQQAQQAAERNMKAADELRRQRYSFPRAGL